MENKLKMRISSLFRSCKSKKINTDVFQQPVYYFANHHQHRQLIDIFSPKHPPFASAVDVEEEEPESPESFPTHHQSSCTAIRRKLCGRRRRDHHHLPQVTDVESPMCPHALPISTFTTQNFRGNDKVKKGKRSKKVRSRSSRTFGVNYEFPVCNYNGLFSSDEDEEDDDDRTTFFSSRSRSSTSSDLLLRRNKDRRRRRSKKTANEKKKNDKRTCPLPEGFAVVKCSKDPYSDFMSSMIEMITEKQIFAGDELEKLLRRFLSLNSDHHHKIIIQVFKDIWDALFTNY